MAKLSVLSKFSAAFAGCVALGVFAGCTEQPASPRTKPLHAGYLMENRSCKAVRMLPVVQLNLDQKRLIHLDKNSPCIVTKAGINEPAALLSLPSAEGVYYVTVRVWRGKSVVVPRMKVLDGEDRLLRTLTYKDMKRSGGALTMTFFVKPGKKGPQYLLLYPDPSLIGQSHERLKQSAMGTFYGFFELFGSAKKSNVVFAEEGTLEVRASSYGTSEPQ